LAKGQASSSPPCRSRLAGEDVITTNDDVACQTAFAGKPAPTKANVITTNDDVACQTAFAGKPAPTKANVITSNDDVACQTAFAGKPAPTKACGFYRRSYRRFGPVFF
jgi:hypothetical protein